jgi:hypothetical protein
MPAIYLFCMWGSMPPLSHPNHRDEMCDPTKWTLPLSDQQFRQLLSQRCPARQILALLDPDTPTHVSSVKKDDVYVLKFTYQRSHAVKSLVGQLTLLVHPW